MKWYSIEEHGINYYVFKNVNKHGIASKSIFKGSYYECKKYCDEQGIKIGYNHRKKIGG